LPHRRHSVSGPGPANLDEARRLIALYTDDTGNAEAVAHAVGQICTRISEHIGPLIGTQGVKAFLVRAVYLARPWSNAIQSVPTQQADGDVAGHLLTCLRGAEAREALGAALAVLGSFIWLLVRFIGEDLGMRLLRDAFADVGSSHRDGESSI
jgi:hypothetical protein